MFRRRFWPEVEFEHQQYLLVVLESLKALIAGRPLGPGRDQCLVVEQSKRSHLWRGRNEQRSVERRVMCEARNAQELFPIVGSPVALSRESSEGVSTYPSDRLSPEISFGHPPQEGAHS